MTFRIMPSLRVSEALTLVRNTIKNSYDALPVEKQKKYPELVAVSKLKPKEMIIEAYDSGQRCFGENYAIFISTLYEAEAANPINFVCPETGSNLIQELMEKSTDPEILEKCPKIKWHFIGHLQSNKVSKLPSIPNLCMVETIHSVKLANLLNNAFSKTADSKKLSIMIQVNTSGESNKSGTEPSETFSLVSHVLEKCPQLEFKGLMTIGALGRSIALPADRFNEDFVSLVECKTTICDKLNLNPDCIALSMGMSSDFEHAIAMGSNSVRVGSTIFGAREKKPIKNVSATNIDDQGKESSTSEEASNIVQAVKNVNLAS
ncbi:Pyridoxal phosphate homeostasis protein [Nymphon striatum]|nr:Pyridoxal phosphate homeostasis protein [Nymphon striatum]